MKFVSQVKKQKISWPTQKRFNLPDWLKKSEELCEDQADTDLSIAGVWTADTLADIRKEVQTSSIWQLSFKHFSRYIIAVCNRDYYMIQNTVRETIDQSPIFLPEFIDELTHKNIDQELYGAETISSRLESSIDAANLNLYFHPGKVQKPIQASVKILAELKRTLFFAVLYQGAEESFYKILFCDWYIKKENEIWFVMPRDIMREAQWAASLKRFQSLLSQFFMISSNIWQENHHLRMIWFNQTGGIPEFNLKRAGDIFQIEYLGQSNNIPDLPPQGFVSEQIAREFYYEPLLNEPLPELGQRNVLELLQVHFMLKIIATNILHQYPTDCQHHTPKKLERYAPILQKEPLIKSISQATQVGYTETLRMIDALTWMNSSDDDLWFQPLVSVGTKKGPGLLLTLLPILNENVYRNVDYWLTKFGLPLKRRGELFEQEIIFRIKEAINEAGLEKTISVFGPIKLTSKSDSSQEEFDVIIRLHSLIIIGEAKCQKFPATSIERNNYLSTLIHAASQASRKANWIKENFKTVTDILGINDNLLSGSVEPIVISNHALGTGMIFDGVPTLDLWLLTNYISRPYTVTATFSPGERMREHKGEPFYSNHTEMAERFKLYAQSPPAINFFAGFLKPQFIYFPMKKDEEVRILDFVMDPSPIFDAIGENTSN